MAKKVYLPQGMAPAGREVLEKAGLEIIDGTADDFETMAREGAQANAVFLYMEPFGAELMDAMPDLKAIARNGVGVDTVDLAAASARGIRVLNTPEANSVSVAEAALTCILTLAKRLDDNRRVVSDGTWQREFWSSLTVGHELSALKVGIIGFGHIARELTKRLLPLGMKVLAYSAHAHEFDGVEFVSFEELLQRSDFVSLHCPGTAETYHMIDAAAFDKMKSSAALVNFARGSVVDTEALIRALQTGEISAAALDVFEEEPLPLTSELLQLQNVILMPHSAASTVEAWNRMARDAAEGIVDVLNGREPRWTVN